MILQEISMIVISRKQKSRAPLSAAQMPVKRRQQPQKVALEIRENLIGDQMQSVRVADSQESCLADLAVISSKFLIPYRGFGILAIIGPVNLDYQQLVFKGSSCRLVQFIMMVNVQVEVRLLIELVQLLVTSVWMEHNV